ncbi:ABC transporter substrate-binding protein [Paenibacillus sp. GCM10012307]|uniref:Extracellular solute-binding protein n=1 Tax=Paenibacillus roseus TaxID=2798579 RepID=A0A934IZ78_9BACL|nr:extracellular solute-binding protein [Paenibacillus roseus]MBJ6360389.1 extracellular solute-binding protein [Paenibacillus roseus]
MRKLSMMMLCLALFSSLLAACGSSGTSEKQPANNGGQKNNGTVTEGTDTPKENDKKVTISIYYPLPDQVERRKLEDDKIRRFQEKYPNVTIEKSDWHYNVNEIGIKMAANEAPTFFNTFATEAKFLVERGWAADITELWNNYAHKDEINPILQGQFNIDGKVFGVTQNGYVTSTVVNKKMLEDKNVPVPSYDWTWDDLLATAQAVADPKKGVSGIAPMGKENAAGWNWTNFLFEAGGEIQTIEGGKVKAAFNSEAGLKALEFYHKLRWEANAIPQDWALNWGDAVGALAQGRTAMVIAGAEGPLDAAMNQGGIKPEDLLTFPMPAYEKGGKHYGILGGDYLVINPNASKDEQEAAFNYITFDYFSDAWLESVDRDIQARKTEGKYFIPSQMYYFKSDSEYGKKAQAIFDKYDNVYKYNAESNKLLDGKPEAQYNTQDYYGAMTNVIQEVFSKKDTDLKQKLQEAADTVQKNFFDKIAAE